jgi:hypothetical protein
VHGTCEAEAIVHGTCEAEAIVHGTCEAGGSIKPGAQAPGKQTKIEARARETGDSVYWFRAVARFNGLKSLFIYRSWGLRPRLYSATCFAGSAHNSRWHRRFGAQ